MQEKPVFLVFDNIFINFDAISHVTLDRAAKTASIFVIGGEALIQGSAEAYAFFTKDDP